MSLDVVTFGCRLNAAESEVIRQQAGANLSGAVVVNTCAVTAEAVRQARQTIRKLRRERPDVVFQVGYNPDITLFLRQAKSGGLRFRMLIGHGAGWSQIDRLSETFGADVNHFCNVDPAGTQMLDWSKLGPGVGDLAKTFV